MADKKSEKKEQKEQSELDDRLEGVKLQADLTGIGFSSVKDGKVMMLTRDFLMRTLVHLDKSGQDRIIVFIQDPDTAAVKKGRS